MIGKLGRNPETSPIGTLSSCRMVWRRFPRSCSVFPASVVTLPTPLTPRVGAPNRYIKSPQGEVKSRLPIAVSEQVARPALAYGQHLAPLNSPHSHSQALACGQCRQRPHTGPTSWAIRTVAAPTGYGKYHTFRCRFFGLQESLARCTKSLGTVLIYWLTRQH
jgi:hypothetical protein